MADNFADGFGYVIGFLTPIGFEGAIANVSTNSFSVASKIFNVGKVTDEVVKGAGKSCIH